MPTYKIRMERLTQDVLDMAIDAPNARAAKRAAYAQIQADFPAHFRPVRANGWRHGRVAFRVTDLRRADD